MTQQDKDNLFIARREEYNRKRDELMANLDACKKIRTEHIAKIKREDDRAVNIWESKLRDLKLEELAAHKALSEQLYAPTENTPDKIARRVGFDIQRTAQHIIDKYAEKYGISAICNDFEYTEHELVINIKVSLINDKNNG